MPAQISTEKFNEMVDKVLEYNGTPRRWLFEYPYNSFESNAIIKKAENLVKTMVSVMEKS